MNHEVLELIGKSEIGRRTFMERTAQSMLGVGIGVPFLKGVNGYGQETEKGGGKAKSLIYIYLSGGMTHLDTFDPKKDGSDVMGRTTTLNTNSDVKLGDKMVNLAKHGDKISVINSMSSINGAHEQGSYIMRTGYNKLATIVHPTMGPMAEKYLGKRGEILPDSVVVGQSTSSAGYLEPSLAPLPIGDPNGGVPNTNTMTSDDRFESRMNMAQKLGQKFVDKYKYNGPQSYVEYYEQAQTLLKSGALDAFDISSESNRADYGEGRLGQGCLLARKLVEKGVRVVEVISGGWDMHEDIATRLDSQVPPLDKALAALVNDLSERGLLDSTLIAVGTEFGRTPNINMNGGRDHYPAAYSTMLAGGGVVGGQVYGETDKQGKKPKDPVKPEDFIATIGHALGIPQEETIYSPTQRPFTWANDGVPVTKLFGA
ncbi:DUF1501 domain-containing protein [Verrucomicrobiales bacterium]|nr:DUF1501 domain-containing protein [Verrucomicrobiales bacterium]MDC0276618.1 DUF1501 domain-containing protein [Verrucomicrobiales bacterium]MDC0322615.1 DUF1501 domain-containing protein [Verrucomicrobiales bacterium]